jgi:hypothetical protein
MQGKKEAQETIEELHAAERLLQPACGPWKN